MTMAPTDAGEPDVEAEVDQAITYFTSANVWPMYETENEARYLPNGVWSIGGKTYQWQHTEAALFDVQDCPYARELGTWRGQDVRDVLALADPDYDGTFWKNSGKTSFVVLYRVEPGVPLQVKSGTKWRDGGGRSEVDYWGAEDFPEYRRLSRELLAARGIDLAAPKLAREKREAEQAERRRRKEWGR